MDYEKAPPENCPQAVFDAVLDTPEPDKWIDCGEVRPLPMFHMHTMMKYAEKCAFTAVTHGVKMEWQPIGRYIHALVNSDGKVLAEVHGTMVYNIYVYAGDKYVSLAQAKAAAERAINTALHIVTPSTKDLT